MRYFQKLLCLLILVLAASFGVGGCVLLYSDFSVQRSRMAAANAAAHAQACTLLQTEILDLQRRGISTGDAALTARVTAQDVPAALWRLSKSGKTEKSIKLFIDSCWNENLYDVNLKGDFKMKKVKSLKALVLSLMLCLAMGTTAFASEVSTQGQAAPNANKAVEVSDCGDLDVVPAYDDAVALADTIQYDANRTITRSNSRSGLQSF